MALDLGKLVKSMTVQGAVVTGGGAAGFGQPVATVLSAVGVPIEPTEAAQLIDAGMVIVGIVMTVAGRIRASGPLKKEG